MRPWSRFTALTILAAASLAYSAPRAWADLGSSVPTGSNSAQPSVVVAGPPVTTDPSLRYGRSVIDRLPLSAAVSMWWIRTFPSVSSARSATPARASVQKVTR